MTAGFVSSAAEAAGAVAAASVAWVVAAATSIGWASAGAIGVVGAEIVLAVVSTAPYKGLPSEVESTDATDAEVDAVIEQLRAERADYKAAGRPASPDQR